MGFKKIGSSRRAASFQRDRSLWGFNLFRYLITSLKLDNVDHALLRLSSKLRFGHFVVEQKSRQNNNALTYSPLTASISILDRW